MDCVDFKSALKIALDAKEKPDTKWIIPLLDSRSDQMALLFKEADNIRHQCVGDGVHLRALVEFSNYCSMDCRYCGIRKSNKTLQRYRMLPEEIFLVAKNAAGLGYKTVVLQSGEDSWYDDDKLCHLVKSIKNDLHLAVTLSIGERSFESYEKIKLAGADRYLLRIETTDEKLFKKLHPYSSLKKRMQCLYDLKDLGYQLGTGIMVGLPGQTTRMIAEDIVWMHKLSAKMIGIGPFIPHSETPLKNSRSKNIDETLKVVALLRLVFRYAHIPATTAMGSLDKFGREKALSVGANVVMPNMTPKNLRDKYELYSGKICLTEEPEDCYGCMVNRIKSLNRTIAKDYGDVI